MDRLEKARRDHLAALAHRRRASAEMRAAVNEAIANGMPQAEVARRLGVSHTRIWALRDDRPRPARQ